MHSPAVIDLHCDTLTAFMAPGRCRNTLNDPGSDFALCKVPAGARWAQCCAIFIPDELRGTQAIRYYEAHQKSFVRQMTECSSLAVPCSTAAQLEQAWAQGKAAAILTVENGSALAGDLDRLEVLARDGVKAVTLSWNGQNEIASGWETDHGLSDFGRVLIPAMEQQGVLVDVSHLNDRSFYDVLERAQKPFLATHSNARSVCSHRRNLTDDQIREMVSRRCLIGLNYTDHFLRDGGGATPEDLFRHIARFLDLGAEDCLALGSDFDGTTLPEFLNSPAKVLHLPDYLQSRGLSAALCRKILFQNALTFFQANLS